MKIMNTILTLLMVVPSFGQVEANYFEVNHPAHRLTFYNSGEYHEYYSCYKGPWGIKCFDCVPVSNGTYVIHNGNFVLTSDKTIPCWQDTLLYKLSESVRESNDSTIFIIQSPYEQLLEEEAECTVCTYPHNRVYLYHFSILCANDSKSHLFELKFNEEQRPTFSNTCTIMIPPEVKIEAVHLEVTWGDTTYLWQNPDMKCSTTIKLPHPPSSSMLYTITLPEFDYFYLAHKKYQEEATRKQRKNKSGGERIIFNGQVYEKLKY